MWEKSDELFDLLNEIQDTHGRGADALGEMGRNYQSTKIVAFIEKGNNHE